MELIDKAVVKAMFSNGDPDVMADYGPDYGTEWGFSRDTISKILDGVPTVAEALLPPMDPIEKAIADWHSELTGIAIKLGRTELLAQLAEEAAELSKAALKLRRVLGGKNPTPVTEAEATLNLQEELTDVLLCAITVGIDRTEVERFIRAKAYRWSARVEGEDDNV